MYAIYSWAANIPREVLCANLAQIYTGETAQANLVSPANSTALTVTSTIAPGWSIHDAAAAGNTTFQTFISDVAANFTSLTTWTRTAGVFNGANIPKGAVYIRRWYVAAGTLHTIKMYKNITDRDADTNPICSYGPLSGTGVKNLTNVDGGGVAFSVNITGNPGGDLEEVGFLASPRITLVSGLSNGSYKYVLINTSSAPNQFGLTAFETWNTTLHSGTNNPSNTVESSANYGVNTTLTATGTLHLQSSVYNLQAVNSVANGKYQGIFEYIRMADWDLPSLPTPYPNYISLTSTSGSIRADGLRVPSATAGSADVTGSSASGGIFTAWAMGQGYNVMAVYNGMTIPTSIQAGGSDLTSKYVLSEIYWRTISSLALNGHGGHICTLSDCFYMPFGGGHLDDVYHDGKLYSLWVIGGLKLAVRKG